MTDQAFERLLGSVGQPVHRATGNPAQDHCAPTQEIRTMTRTQALPYVAYLLDDGLSVHPLADMLPNARLIGWQCGFEPLFVAVQSYLPNTRVDDGDAIDIAIDYLLEIEWFTNNDRDPDYVI